MTDPRPFVIHQALARLWLQWNGKLGTEIQSLRLMDKLTAEELRTMLHARGVRVTPALEVPDVA